MKKKYFLNESTNKLHKEGGKCRYCKTKPYSVRYFETIDDVIKYSQRYFSYCKTCFKNEEDN